MLNSIRSVLLLPLVVIFILTAVIYCVRVSVYKMTTYINEAMFVHTREVFRVNVFIIRIKEIHRKLC